MNLRLLLPVLGSGTSLVLTSWCCSKFDSSLASSMLFNGKTLRGWQPGLEKPAVSRDAVTPVQDGILTRTIGPLRALPRGAEVRL